MLDTKNEEVKTENQNKILHSKSSLVKLIVIISSIIILLGITIMGYLYSKSPEFAIYNSIVAMKDNDYNKTIQYINIEKITNNRVDEYMSEMLNDPSIADNPFAGLAYMFVDAVKPKFIELLQDEFKKVVESPDNIFQQVSKPQLLLFTIVKKHDGVSIKTITKEPKKVVFEFNDGKNIKDLRIYLVKNSNNNWEIVDLTGYEFWKDSEAEHLQHQGD